MTKRTLYLLGILLTGIIGAILNWFLCCPSGGEASIKTESPVVAPVVKTSDPSLNPFSLTDADGDFNFSTNDNFNFNISSLEILKPLSTTVDGGIEKLKSYLDANPGKSLNIFGHYKSSEKNTSVYSNLGIARANAVKNYLVEKGISSKLLNTFGKLDNDFVPDGNILKGPITFKITTTKVEDDSAAKDAAELKKLHDDLVSNPIALYFATNADDLSLNASQRDYITKLSKYLDKVEDAKVSVVGHTDFTGDAASNKVLGLARANTIKSYLVKNQILASKIESSSKGEENPIADNTTKSGRAKNRRVEITLK